MFDLTRGTGETEQLCANLSFGPFAPCAPFIKAQFMKQGCAIAVCMSRICLIRLSESRSLAGLQCYALFMWRSDNFWDRNQCNPGVSLVQRAASVMARLEKPCGIEPPTLPQ